MTNMELPKKFLNVVTVSITTIADVRNVNFENGSCPGVSPIVYSRFLIESAVFLSLNDMGKELPDYEEIPIELSLHPTVMEEYKRIENTLIEVMRNDKKVARKLCRNIFN